MMQTRLPDAAQASFEYVRRGFLQGFACLRPRYLPNKDLRMVFPIFRSSPAFEVGMPAARANLCRVCVIPRALFHENVSPGMRRPVFLLAISPVSRRTRGFPAFRPVSANVRNIPDAAKAAPPSRGGAPRAARLRAGGYSVTLRGKIAS